MKKIIMYLLSFILMACIVASIFTGIIANTVANKTYFLGKLEEISFYDRTEEEINDTFKNYILQSGMDETVLVNLYDKAKLKQDIQNLVDAIYENKELSVETESVKEKLNANIETYLAEKQLTVENTEEVERFVETIAETYKDGIIYSTKAIEKITPITTKLIKVLQNIQPILYATTAILFVILIAMNWKEKIEIAKYLGISLLAAGLTTSAIKLFITTQIHIEGILIVNKIVTNLIQNISNQVLDYIFYMGAIVAIIGIVGIIVKIMSIKEVKEV